MGKHSDICRRSRSIGIAALIVIAGLYVQGQTFYGSIVGTVTDPSGASVPASSVTLTNIGTSERRVTETDAAGNYQFVNLVPGRYRVDIEKTGFKHFTRDDILVQVQDAVRIDVSMQVGAVGELVEVTAQTPLLQTESTSLGQVVESRTVQEMPLNGRNVFNLVSLVPGVVPLGQTTGNPALVSNNAWGNYQIGGGMGNQSASFLDGGPLNVGYVNLTALVPAQDSVQEFRVQTNNLGPEFGRFAGGVVNLTSKSGTNLFHGSAYEFLRNKVLNANSFFANRSGLPRVAFTQNQFGVTVGGPVIKDKTFFFFGYEGFRLAQAGTVISTVPTPAMRNGDFSDLRDGAGRLIPISDPLTTCGVLGNPPCSSTASSSYTRTQFPGNVIPRNRLDPTAVALTNLWAQSNAAGQTFTHIQNYVANIPSHRPTDQYNIRGDQNISSKQRLFGRYTNYAIDYPPQDWYGTKTTNAGSLLSQQAVVADTYTFSPTTIADFRLAWLRFSLNLTMLSLGTDLTQVGWPRSLIDQMLYHAYPIPVVQGYNDVLCGCIPEYIFDTNNSYSGAGTLTKIVGRHTLKFGGEYRALQFNFAQTNNASGSYNFDNLSTAINPFAPTGTGYGFASFMLGYGSSGTLIQSPRTASQQIYQAYFASDTYQVNRRLTLNYGIRWELPGPWTERYDRLTVLLPNSVSPLAQPTGLPLRGKLGLVNSPDRPSRYNQDFQWKLFAPRLGLAYRITDQTVARLGYGIFFLPNDISFNSGPYGSPVNNTTTTWVPTLNNQLTPATTLSNPFPNGILQPPGRSPSFQSLLEGQTVTSLLPSDPYAYTQQWNVNLERQLGNGMLVEAAYAGSKGTHLPYWWQELNQLPDQYLSLGSQLQQQVTNPFYGLIPSGPLSGATIPYGQLLRPFPQYNSVRQAAAANRNSTYHSLQLKLEKRFGSGGTILASYTFSKLIADVDTLTAWNEPNGAAGQQGAAQDHNNIRLERSLGAFDVPHRFIVSYVLDLPFGSGKKWLGGVRGISDKLVSGWGVNGVTTFQSAFPVGLTTASNVTNSFGGGSRPNVTAGCDKSVAGSAQDRLNRWFNTSCFSAPPAFTFGSESRTDPNIRTHGIANYDFALFKRTAITEQIGIELRVEAFNLFNRVQFGYPGTTFGTPQFGIVGYQLNNPRLVQLAARLHL